VAIAMRARVAVGTTMRRRVAVAARVLVRACLDGGMRVRGVGSGHRVVLQSVLCVDHGWPDGQHPLRIAATAMRVPGNLATTRTRTTSGRRDGPRVRIRAGWGILLGLMARITALPSLLMALLAVPLVAGCQALGLPSAGDALDTLPAAGVEGDSPTPGAEPSPTFFSSNDGYALTLPAGWIATKTNGNASRTALEQLGDADPALAADANSMIDLTGAHMSMAGVDAADLPGLSDGGVPRGLAILVMSTDGASDDETQQGLGDIVEGLSTLNGPVTQGVASVAAGDAHTYDFVVTGDGMSIHARAYLFTVGDDGVIVLFGADPSVVLVDDSDVLSIIKSLRFGV